MRQKYQSVSPPSRVCECVIHDPPHTGACSHVSVGKPAVDTWNLPGLLHTVEVIFGLSPWLASMTVLSSHLSLGIIPPPSLSLCPWNSRIRQASSPTQYLYECYESERLSPSLHAKPFVHWAISEGPPVFLRSEIWLDFVTKLRNVSNRMSCLKEDLIRISTVTESGPSGTI